jgi:phage I-like protein
MNEHLKRLLELNYKAKEKVLISPVGAVVGLDGRTFNIDGEAVIANTIANGIDLVFEVDHGFTELGGKSAGWFKFDSLELKDDGIYASLETTTLGDELIDKKLYRYISPAYIMDRNKSDRTVLALDSVGLVNRPNLIKDALNSKDKEVIN